MSAGACAYIASVLDFGTLGRHRIGWVGDSLTNDAYDPPRKLLWCLAAATPAAFGLREYLNSGGDTPAISGSPITVRAGESTPDQGGVIFADSFATTRADIVGAASSGGQAWAGTAGRWAAVDGYAYPLVTGASAAVFNAGSKTQTVTADLTIVSTAPAATRQFRLYADATTTTPATSGNYVCSKGRLRAFRRRAMVVCTRAA